MSAKLHNSKKLNKSTQGRRVDSRCLLWLLTVFGIATLAVMAIAVVTMQSFSPIDDGIANPTYWLWVCAAMLPIFAVNKRYQRTAAIGKYSLWVVCSFVLAQVVVGGVLWLLQASNVSWQGALSSNTINVILGSVTYTIMLLILIGAPAVVRRARVSLQTLGIQWLPTWRDIGLACVGIVLYFIASVILTPILSILMPWIDMTQQQDIGISAPQGAEMWLTFALLVVVAPVVEEVVFRGYLYGKLRKRHVSVWVSVLLVSVLFGAAHMQWNVAVNVAILSVFMCLGREITGSIWTGIIMHMMKNGLAFYLLFVNPIMVGIL